MTPHFEESFLMKLKNRKSNSTRVSLNKLNSCHRSWLPEISLAKKPSIY